MKAHSHYVETEEMPLLGSSGGILLLSLQGWASSAKRIKEISAYIRAILLNTADSTLEVPVVSRTARNYLQATKS